MKVQDLRTVLEEVKAIYDASGADKSASDFADFLELLDGHEDQDIDDFLAELSSLLRATSEKGRKAQGGRQPDAQIVASFLDRLTSAKTDQTEFDVVYAQLGANKQVRVEEMNAIAHGYIKGRESWGARTAAYKAIKKKFIERADRESRTGILSKIRRWG
jgi:hypothetical protein